MPVNIKLVQRKITLINRDLKNLKEISAVPLAKFISNDSYEALAERYLERIIGRMIDINYHILTEDGEEAPLDYYNSFVRMGGKKYLPLDFASSLADAAGLRNRLAHEYDEIDVRKIYQAVPKCLKDAPRYLLYISKYLDKQAKQKSLF